MTIRTTRFGWPLGFYFFSLVGGVVIAYPAAEPGRPFAFACAALALYHVLASLPSQTVWRGRVVQVLRPLIAAVPLCLTTYFIATNDWAQPVDKVEWQESIRQLLATAQPSVAVRWPRMHPNVAGGLLAMWLPLQVAALAPGRNQLHSGPTFGASRLGSILLIAWTGAGLMLSGLRGAWLALAFATLTVAVLRLAGRQTNRRPASPAYRLAAGLLLIGAGLLAWALLGGRLLALRLDRLEVWRNSWMLAWDYAFTGLGLGGFPMAYSSYALLVHVPHTYHAHNLFLDIWLAQGLLGLCAFAWLVGSAGISALRALSVRAAPAGDHSPGWATAAATALLTLLLHGLVDDPYYGYGSAGLVFLFVPVALLARHSRAPRPDSGRPARGPALAMCAAAMVLLLLALRPAGRAQVEANLGALAQTSTELSVYHWPEWPIQDAVRRSRSGDLAAAIQHYDAALAVDAGNITANRRLGQIELSLGQYESARAHLENAYARDGGQETTRQLFGESLAVTGAVERAAAIWRSLPLEEDQLEIRKYWYESVGDRVAAERLGAAIAILRRSADQIGMPVMRN